MGTCPRPPRTLYSKAWEWRDVMQANWGRRRDGGHGIRRHGITRPNQGSEIGNHASSREGLYPLPCPLTMRPLTEDENKAVFEKLANYIASTSQIPPPRTYPRTKGKNVVHLVDRQDDAHCFRLHKGRVYYVSEASMRLSISVARSNLLSLGTCLGKFSKSGKFKLHITSLDYLAQYARYKVSLWPTMQPRPSDVLSQS